MPRRRFVCHHEAGHALARWYFGHRTDRVRVMTFEAMKAGRRFRTSRGILHYCEGLTEGYDIIGYPFGRLPVEGGRAAQAECDRIRAISRDMDLIGCKAGYHAEAHYKRRSIFEGALRGGRDDMRHIMTILDAWELHVTEDHRHAIDDASEHRARALVRSPQGAEAIRLMADALMARGELSGAQIGALCRRAYGGRECAYGAWLNQWPPTLAQLRAGFIPERPAAALA